MDKRPTSVADWLDELAALDLVELDARTATNVERLLRHLRSRGVTDPHVLADSLATLLAKNDDRYQKIRASFLRAFQHDVPLDVVPEPPLGSPAPTPPNLTPRQTPARTPAPTKVSAFLRRAGRLLPNRAWVGLIAVSILVFVAVLPTGTIATLGRFFPKLGNPPREARSGNWSTLFWHLRPAPPPPVCGAKLEPTLKLVASPTSIVLTPNGLSNAPAPGPGWRFLLFWAGSVFLGMLATAWWFLNRRYAKDREDERHESEENRARELGASDEIGALYDVERAAPIDTRAIDDAATLLGRLARPEPGFDLDVPKTIEATIDAGGRIQPVFARGGRRDALLVWVDIESGAHPYLDGVNWILERWKRLGVPFVRYDFCERPALLTRASDHRRYTIEKLGHLTEDMPLVIFSQFRMPEDYRGKMLWLQQLDKWPVRAWVDLHAFGEDATRGDTVRLLPRIVDRLPRYPLTKAGLVACAAALAGATNRAWSEARREVLHDEHAREQALWWWACAAACVPNPDWVHVDDLRRFLPEVSRVFSEARDVQHLIDFTCRENLGEGFFWNGPALRFSDEGRLQLLLRLAEMDVETFDAAKPGDTVGDRVRRRLIQQLERARTPSDKFGEAKRAMKIDVHRAHLGEVEIVTLIEQYGRGAAARELLPLLEDLLHVDKRVPLGSKRPNLDARTRDVVATWTGQRKGVRAVDLLAAWRTIVPAGVGLACLLLFAASAPLARWVRPFAPVTQVQMPASWKVVLPDPKDEPVCPALPDVAPMKFVRIAGGEFVMGSPETDEYRFEDETQHLVKVGPFEMAETELTQKQWATVMGTKPFDCSLPTCVDDLPAQNISWFDAVKFMNKLTDRDNVGKPLEQQRTRCYDETNWTWDRTCTGYRLPTEAEWEFATRGGATTTYSSGDQARDLCAYGNGADRTAKNKHPELDAWNETCADGYADLAPVSSFKPNPFGLYDMQGNVWEWVWDKYANYSDKPMTSDNDKHGDSPAASRVLRGGSYMIGPRWLRSAARFRIKSSLSLGFVGLRCVRSVFPSG